MSKLVKNIFVLVTLLNLGFNSFTSYSYELKYGNGDGIISTSDQSFDLNFLEHFLKINSSYEKYDLFMEIEYSDPPLLGYKRNKLSEVINSFYIDRKFKKSHLRLGNIYSLYGAGLSLYTFPDQDIDFDNSIYGFEYVYNFNQFNFFILSGGAEFEQRTNPAKILPDRFFDINTSLIGFDYDFQYGFGHFLFKKQNTRINNNTLQTFYFPELERYTIFDNDIGSRIDSIISNNNVDIQNIGDPIIEEKSINLGYGVISNLGDFYFELDLQNYNKILGPRVDGSRIYFSYGNNFGDFGVTYEYKNYDIPYGIITLSSPPTALIESNSILAARNSRSINYGDEVGHQLELIRPISDNFNIMTTVSFSRRNQSDKVEYRRGGEIENIIGISNFNGLQGSDEDDYLLDLLTLSNSIISNPSPRTLSLDSNNFLDNITFDEKSDNFRSFYPFRQIYSEVNGYFTDNFYFKFGYDIYDEIKNFKSQDFYINDYSALNTGFSSFYNHAETIVNDVLSYHETNPNDFCDIIQSCSDNPGEFGFQQQFGQSSDNFLSNLSFNNLSDYDEISTISYEHDSALTIPSQFTYDLGSGNSLNLYLEYQKKNIDKHEYTSDEKNIFRETYKNKYLSASYTGKSFYTLTYFLEKQNYININKVKTKSSWSGFDLSLDLKSNGIISFFSGSQKGGIVCANGICAEQPGFDGFKLTYRTFLN